MAATQNENLKRSPIRRTAKPKFSYVVDDAVVFFFFFFLRMAGMALVMRLLELFQGGTMRKYNFISFR